MNATLLSGKLGRKIVVAERKVEICETRYPIVVCSSTDAQSIYSTDSIVFSVSF